MRDVTSDIEHSHSLRDSERRYRMLTGSLRDVIFTTDSAVHINYVSPAVQTVFGYSPEWALQHGLDQLVTRPGQAERFYELMRRVRKASFNAQALAELGQSLQLRYTPELVWEQDDSITYGAKMLKLIGSLEVNHDDDGADEG